MALPLDMGYAAGDDDDGTAPSDHARLDARLRKESS
jgi:hypothetical protein